MAEFLKVLQNDFSYQVDSLMRNPEFYYLPDNEKGLQLNQVYDSFLKENNIAKEEDRQPFQETLARKFQSYRDEKLIPRYIPPAEDQQKYYEPLNLSETDSKDDQIKKIDEWKDASLKKASTLRPANEEDFSYHLNSVANEQIRRLNGKDTGWIGDKANRLFQGVVEPVSRLAFGEEKASRYFAENLAENPQYDEDISSQIAAGIGDTLFQASLSVVTGVTLGPEASVAALGIYNTSRMMRDSYEQEMKRTGNAVMAFDSAINQLPAAALETFADAVVFGSLAKLSPVGASLRKSFMEAGSVEAKKAILKEAVPSLGKLALKSGISEATLGGFGAEFTSGYGSYLATGDEKYLRSMDELVKSGIVEGTVGLLFGAGMSGIERGHARGEAASDLAFMGGASHAVMEQKQNEIYTLLKSGNYQGVIDTFNKVPTTPDPAAPKTGTASVVKAGVGQGVQVTKIFGPKHFGEMDRKIQQYENESDPIKKAEMQEEYDRIKPLRDSVRDGTYKPSEDFQVNFKPTDNQEDITFFESKDDNKVAAKPYSSFEIELEDGSLLPDDNPTYIVYTKNPTVSNLAFNQLQGLRGTPTLALSKNGGKAKIVLDKGAKGFAKTNAEFSVSWKPGVGKTPIAIYDVEDADGNVVGRKVKILPRVKSAEKFSKKDNYQYVDSIFDNAGNLIGVKVRHNSKEVALYGEEAFEIANNERQKSNKVMVDNAVSRVEQGQKELADLQAAIDALPPEEKAAAQEAAAEEQPDIAEAAPVKPTNIVSEVTIPAGVRVSKEDSSKFLDNLDDGNYEWDNGDNKFTLSVRTVKGKRVHVLTSQDGVITGKANAVLQLNQKTKLTRNDNIPIGTLTFKTISDRGMDKAFKLAQAIQNNQQVSNDVLDESIAVVERKRELVKDMTDPEEIKEEIEAIWETLVVAKERNNRNAFEEQNKNIDVKNPPAWIKSDPRFKELSVREDVTEEDLQTRIEQIIEENEITRENTRLGDFEGREVTIDGITGILSIDPTNNKGIITTKDGHEYETVHWSTPVADMEFQEWKDPAVAAIVPVKPKLVNRNPVQINGRGLLVNKKSQPVAVKAASIKAPELNLKERAVAKKLREKNKKVQEKSVKNETKKAVVKTTDSSIAENLDKEFNKLDFSNKVVTGESKGKGIAKVLIDPTGKVVPIPFVTGHPKYVQENYPQYLTEDGRPDVRKMVKEGWFWGSVTKDENGNYALVDAANDNWINEYNSSKKDKSSSAEPVAENPKHEEYYINIVNASKGASGTVGAITSEVNAIQSEDNTFIGFLQGKLNMPNATVPQLVTAIKKGNDKNFGKAASSMLEDRYKAEGGKEKVVQETLPKETMDQRTDRDQVDNASLTYYLSTSTPEVNNFLINGVYDNTVKTVLETIADSSSPFNFLAEELLLMSNETGMSLPVYYVEDSEDSTSYIRDKGILITPKNTNENGEIRDAVVMHELIHALTVTKFPESLIRGNKKGIEYRASLQKVLDDKSVEKPIKDLINLYLETVRQLDAASDLFGGIGEDANSSGTGGDAAATSKKGIPYGLGNVQEFITESFTKPPFQELLNKLKAPNSNKSIWQSLLDAIRKFLGFDIKSESILESVIATSMDIVKMNKDTSWDVSKPPFYPKNYNPVTKKYHASYVVKDGKIVKENDNVESLDEFDEDSDVEDVTNLLTGKKSQFRKQADKYINSLKKTEVEQKLLIDEKPAYNQLKRISYGHLNDKDLRDYIEILKDFIHTRSHVKDPQTTRIQINEIMTRAANLEKIANQGRFDFLKETNPEAFGPRDGHPNGLTFEDFSNDITAVEDYVGQQGGMKDIGASNEERLEWHDKIVEIQDELRSRVDSGEIGNVDNLFNYLENPIDHGNEHLNKANTFIGESHQDAKDFYRDYIAYQVSVDPSTITSFRDVRNLYYSLLSITTDGYPLSSNNFITTQLNSLLQEQGIQFRNASNKIGETATEKSSSFATKLSNLAKGQNASDALYKLTSLYRESIKRAERFENEVINPYLNEINAKREKEAGRPFNNEDHSRMGIYAMLRQHHVDETPTEGFFKNVAWLRQSLDNHARTQDKNLNKFSKFGDDFINELMEGIEDNDSQAMVKLEANALRLMGEAQVGYVADGVKLFDALKPQERFSQEFGYGRRFQEIINYIPSYSSQIRESIKNGDAYNNQQMMNIDELRLNSDFESFLNGRVGHVRDPRINTSGMSSTKVRHRVVADNRVLELNINRLLHNRARLNALDAFTSVRRREMANVLKSAQLREWLGDSDGQLGRVDYLNRVITRSWQNLIQNTSYLGPFHVVMNKLMSRFASFRLFGFYQLPAQTISNSMTYFAQNITQPTKILDFFKASSFIMANRNNPQFKPFLDRLLSDLRNRSQEVFLDKTSSMDVKVDTIWQDFKQTNLFKGIRDIDNLRQDIMFKPFKWSDMFSGEPMLLAEYLHLEKEKGRASSFADLTYNPESYFQALDTTEKMIGIGAASRRGLWLHNRDSSIALIRNLLTMFSSHRINNATNFGVALRDVRDGSLPIEDRSRAAQFMLGVTVQSAAFAAVKGGLMIMLGQAIMGAAKGDEDDDLESLYSKNKDLMSKKEKEVLEQEISTRRNIRAALHNFENRNSSARLMAINTGKELLSNIWFATAFSDMPSDFFFHFTFDEAEERGFKEFKEGELDRLNKLIEDTRNPKERARIMEARSDLQSQEAMKVVFENHSIVNMGGLIGPFVKQNFDFMTQTRDSLLDHGEVTLEDISILFGAYGVGSPDLSRYLKLREKVLEARINGEEKKKEAIAKLHKDHKL